MGNLRSIVFGLAFAVLAVTTAAQAQAGTRAHSVAVGATAHVTATLQSSHGTDGGEWPPK